MAFGRAACYNRSHANDTVRAILHVPRWRRGRDHGAPGVHGGRNGVPPVGATAALNVPQPAPDWVVASWEQRVGTWIAENPSKSGPNAVDAFGIDWRWGLGKKSLMGRLHAIRSGRDVGTLWDYHEYWHPGERQLIAAQYGNDGSYGVGVHTTRRRVVRDPPDLLRSRGAHDDAGRATGAGGRGREHRGPVRRGCRRRLDGERAVRVPPNARVTRVRTTRRVPRLRSAGRPAARGIPDRHGRTARFEVGYLHHFVPGHGGPIKVNDVLSMSLGVPF